jgi:hypothetical protein
MHPRMMVHAAISVLAVALAAQPLCAQGPPRPAAPARAPVLVELFTSEGCSSCPPADALLARLDHDQPVPSADIIVLGEHVDYWDSLGWHDRFSSHEVTERQNVYAQRFRLDGPYTPQMVVDGTAQFVGSDSAHILRGIGEAARAHKVALGLSALAMNGTHLTGSVSLAPSAGARAGALGEADLYAVLVESTASTRVQRGENGGRTLHHASPVLAMQRIGSLDALARAPLPFSLALPPDTASGNIRVIVFAQRTGQGGVVAAVSSTPAATSSANSSIAAAQ